MSRLAAEEFFDRYRALTAVLGKTITQFEKNSELGMKSAALYLKKVDTEQGLVSSEQLKKYLPLLGLSHFFIVDRNGKFIRSTNEEPDLIPNLFSFCSKYRDLIGSPDKFESTPIIPAHPETKPFKFLTMPNSKRARFIHVALRVDFIDEMLKQNLMEDENLQSLDLFAPDGTNLGNFNRSKFKYEKWRDGEIPNSRNEVVKVAGGYRFSSWVDSAHIHCCQCISSGNTRAGKYQYLIRAMVLDKPLIAAQNKITYWTILIFLFSVLVSVALSRTATRRLVSRLNNLTTEIREMGKNNSILPVLESGKDEIAELAKSFNHLIMRYQDSQRELLNLERERAISETATRVAHDIRSPLSAINMVLGSLKDIPDEKIQVLLGATSRVNEIADDLLGRYKKGLSASKGDISFVSMSRLLEQLYEETNVRLYGRSNIELKIVQPTDRDISCRIDEPLLYRAINNCINNAIEAMPNGGTLTLALKTEKGLVSLIIRDTGTGIPDEILGKLGKERVSYGKPNSKSGAGIGLFSAIKNVESMGGKFTIQSRQGEGTMISIRIHRANQTIST